MKNKLYNLGLFASILILFGCMFKISHWAGAGIMLTLGIVFFCFVFLPAAISSSLKSKDENKNKGLYIIAYISITFNFISALFKIMHWPGAGILLAIGIPMPFILFLPTYLIYNRNDKEINYRNFVAIMFFFAYFAAISALLSVSVSKDILDESVVSAYQLEQRNLICNDLIVNKIQNIESKNDSLAVSKKKTIASLKESSDKVNKSIEELKIELVKSTNKENLQFIGPDNKINFWEILGKDNSLIPIAGTEAVIQLKNQLNEYHEFLLSLIQGRNMALNGYIDHLLTTKGEDGKEWEMSIFSGRNMITAIGTLNQIKYNVALSELEILFVMDNRSGQ
jgi:hypothetical protein